MSDPVNNDPRSQAGGAAGNPHAQDTETPVMDRLPSTSKLFSKPPRPAQSKPSIRFSLTRKEIIALAGVVGVLMVGIIAFFAVRALAEGGCDTFSSERTSISSDGLVVSVSTSALNGPYGVKLESVAVGQASGANGVKEAFEALPAALKPVGNFYIIRSCQNAPHKVTLKLTIPPTVDALNAIDLYAWDASTRAWRWVGGQVDAVARTMTAVLAKAPPTLLLVQTAGTAPVIGAEMPASGAARVAGVTASNEPETATTFQANEYNLLGLYLGDAGTISGDRSRLYAATGVSTTLIPSVRNWNDKGTVNRTLLREMLESDNLRAAHVSNLVSLAELGNYAGVEVDYRGLDAAQRPQYSAFITRLGQELRAKGKSLVVGLPLPVSTQNPDPEMAWDWLGYDATAISAAADVVRLDFSTDPTVFGADTLKKLMTWVTSHVNRNRLQLVLPSLSVKKNADGSVDLLSMEEALAPLGTLALEQPISAPLQPGAKVRFTLRGAVDPAAVVFDEASQTYHYSMADASGGQQTVWLGTTASLRGKLSALAAYDTRGVTVRGLNQPGNDPGMAQVVQDYMTRANTAASAAPAPLLIAWSVSAPDGTGSTSEAGFDQPFYEWTAPNAPGGYVIAAAVRGGGASDISRGTQSVQVAAPPTLTPIPTATPLPTAVPVAAPTQAAVAPKQAVAQPAPTKAPPPPPPPAGNFSGFGLGGHIKTTNYLGQMAGIGMTWVKYQVVMPGGAPDLAWLINVVHGSGLKLLVGAVGDRGRASDTNYHREFAAALATVAQQGADAIEVWNEPNLDREYGYGKVDGANYTNMLREAYTAIKAVSPGTMVIGGANAPTGYFGGGCSGNGCDDSYFLARMNEAGAASYMDCMGAHHNGSMVGPDQTNGAPTGEHYSWYFWGTLNMTYNSFGGKVPVCFTELGYVTGEGIGALPGGFSWGSNTTLANQAQWLARAAQLGAQSGKVRVMIIWNIDFRQWDEDPQAGFSIFRPDGSCPACDTIRAAMGR